MMSLNLETTLIQSLLQTGNMNGSKQGRPNQSGNEFTHLSIYLYLSITPMVQLTFLKTLNFQ